MSDVGIIEIYMHPSESSSLRNNLWGFRVPVPIPGLPKPREFDILIDSKKVSNISYGGKQTFEVTPGKHTVEIQCARTPYRTECLNIDVHVNSPIKLECGYSSQYEKQIFWVWASAILLVCFGFVFGVPLAAFIVALIICIRATAPTFKAGTVYYLKNVDGNS